MISISIFSKFASEKIYKDFKVIVFENSTIKI